MAESELANAAWWAWFWNEIEHWSFLAVVVFLAIEFAALKLGAPFKETLDRAKEVQVAALQKEAEKAKAEIAQANAAAANATLELERLKAKQAPWLFGDKERAIFAASLRSQPRGKILIMYSSADGTRSSDFADALNRVLKTELGFDVWGYLGPFTSAGPSPLVGIEVTMTDESTRALRAALGEAFKAIGITPRLDRGAGMASEPGQVIISVGIKPSVP